jgi:hypothetical protein
MGTSYTKIFIVNGIQLFINVGNIYINIHIM